MLETVENIINQIDTTFVESGDVFEYEIHLDVLADCYTHYDVLAYVKSAVEMRKIMDRNYSSIGHLSRCIHKKEKYDLKIFPNSIVIFRLDKEEASYLIERNLEFVRNI